MSSSNKVFRVFISSTFKDFKNERNMLQEKVFPRLKRLCSEKNFGFQAIDMRWGVRDSEISEQKTVQLCLEEIERCQSSNIKPNFISLIGNRYGYRPVPYEIPEAEYGKICNELTQEEVNFLNQWFRLDENSLPNTYLLQSRNNLSNNEWWEIEEKINLILRKNIFNLGFDNKNIQKYVISTTEHEINKGIFDSVNSKNHVHVFIREIENINSHEMCDDYFDIKSDGEIDSTSDDLLKNLKNRIYEYLPNENIHKYFTKLNKNGISENYLKKLEEDVFKYLSDIIISEMEKYENIPELEEEISNQNEFRKTKCNNFTGRYKTIKKIEDYIKNGKKKPLIIYGDSGIGKTSLMAYTSKKFEMEYKDAEIIYRSIGATYKSSELSSLLYSLCNQISKCYNDNIDNLSFEYDMLVETFRKKIRLATKKKPLIILLDGLNNLVDLYDIFQLGWIPQKLPNNVSFIVTTTSQEYNRFMKEFFTAADSIELKNMSVPECNDLFGTLLEKESRTLTKYQKKEILSKIRENSSPLFVNLVFEESKRWKSYTPNEKIIIGNNIKNIIENTFNQLSKKTKHGPILTSKVLSYIYTSKYGLSEDEMLGILSKDSEVLDEIKKSSKYFSNITRVPYILWSKLYFDLKPYLSKIMINETTILSFFHDKIREVVNYKYLWDSEKINEIHLNISEYFKIQPLNARNVDELAYNLYNASLDELYNSIKDLSFLYELSMVNEENVIFYWKEIENNTNYRAKNTYEKYLNNPSKYPFDSIRLLARFFDNNLNLKESYSLYDFLIKESKKKKISILNSLLGDLGRVLLNLGEYKKTLNILDEKIKMDLDKNNKIELGSTFLMIGNVYQKQGFYEKAEEYYNKAEKIFLEEKNYWWIQIILGNKGLLLSSKGKFEEASDFHIKEEEICEKYGYDYHFAISKLNQGLIFKELGKFEDAIEIFDDIENKFLELGFKKDLAITYINKAKILRKWGNLLYALELLDNALNLLNSTNIDKKVDALTQKGLIYSDIKCYHCSIKFHKMTENICRNYGLIIKLNNSLLNQATIFRHQKKYDKAEKIHEEVKENIKYIDSDNDKALALFELGNLYGEIGKLDSAIKVFDQAKRIFEDIPNYNGQGICLTNKARAYENKYREKGEINYLYEALEFLDEAEKMFIKINDNKNLEICLGNKKAISHLLM